MVSSRAIALRYCRTGIWTRLSLPGGVWQSHLTFWIFAAKSCLPRLRPRASTLLLTVLSIMMLAVGRNSVEAQQLSSRTDTRWYATMMVRNKSVATSPVFVGVVPSDLQAVPLRVPTEDDKQDNHVAHNRPIPVSLRDSNLI